jgi:hypothetical protein
MTPDQRELDAKLWWTTVRPWLAQLPPSWPSQHHPRTPEEITAGITAARQALAGGDEATAAYLTGIPEDEITRILEQP